MRCLAVACLVAYTGFWLWMATLSDDPDDERGGVLAVLLSAALVLAPLTYLAWRRPGAAWIFVVAGLMLGLFWLWTGWFVGDIDVAIVVIALAFGGLPLLAGLLFRGAGYLGRKGGA